MEWIDTHTHLYTEEFNKDRAEVMQRAIDKGLTRFYLPAIDSNYTDAMESLEEAWPGKVFLLAGLHPCSVKEDFKQDLDKIERQLQERSFAGIGETGLDFYWDTTFKNEQIESLHKHISWALQYQKPLILHTRNSIDEAIEIVQTYKNQGLTGIFHCFSGSVEQAHKIIDTGFYLGIGGVLTFKNSGLDKVVRELDLSHLVLETDSPYLAPTPHRGKRNESSYLPLIAQKLADVKQISLEQVAGITTENAKHIFENH